MISGFEVMVFRASSKERAFDAGTVLEEEDDVASGMIRSWLLLIHTYEILVELQIGTRNDLKVVILVLTRLSAISGFSHRGKAFAASIKRNSPSVSTTLIHRSRNTLLNSRRM